MNWIDNTEKYGLGGRIKTAVVNDEYIAAFGGEWRVSSSVMLSYGIRCLIDNNFKFRNVLPLASISCLMR